MISVKISAIIAIAAFAAGSLFAPPVQQAIAAVIATDVQCTGCVGTSDVGGNAITAAKIKDGEVKAAEIATDAVGAAEMQGVSKLLFAQCKTDSAESATMVPPDSEMGVSCDIAGVDEDDSVIATLNNSGNCFEINRASVSSEGSWVNLALHNQCQVTINPGTGTTFGIIVYDK